jgi:proteic killer suppression protein
LQYGDNVLFSIIIGHNADYHLNLMCRVPDTIALAKYNGLNFENLKGIKAGISSIRVNKQYRIEFTVTDTGVESIATVCNILELSNHYK